MILYILGNKCDMASLREVEFSEAEALCDHSPEIIATLETSAKDSTNIDEAFFTLASELKVSRNA